VKLTSLFKTKPIYGLKVQLQLIFLLKLLHLMFLPIPHRNFKTTEQQGTS